MRLLVTVTLCLGVCAGCDSGKPTPSAPAPAPQLGGAKPAAPDAKPALNSATSPSSEETAPMLKVESMPCGELPDGTAVVTLYTLSNSHRMQVKIINFGGIIIGVEAPDRNGRSTNVTAGFPGLEGYFANAPYFGGICGRFANRISNAKFALDGEDYQLQANIPPNHLHGGTVSFIKKVWEAEIVKNSDSVGVELEYVSPDGEEGYPGELTVRVTYLLNDQNELAIHYKATTDKPTVLNLTNHAYWNLAGSSSSSILDHELTLECDEYIEIDENAIPTGNLLPVAGTCMDFTTPHTIGDRIAETTNGNGGYDHCFVVRGGGKGELVPVAKVVEPTTGRVMEISSTEPGVQLYTGNYLTGTPETGDVPKQGAFCLEMQHFPDSPNRPEFPTVVLRPGETYRQTTVHKFSVAK